MGGLGREGKPPHQVTAGTYIDPVSNSHTEMVLHSAFQLAHGSGFPPSLCADETVAKAETEQGKSSPEGGRRKGSRLRGVIHTLTVTLVDCFTIH